MENNRELEVKEFIEENEDNVLDYLDNDIEEDEIISEIQSNTNKYTEEEISSLLDDSASMIHKWYDDRCISCGALLTDDCYETESNSVPYGDTMVDEQTVSGCICSSCGEEQ